MNCELPELKSLCQSPWKRVTKYLVCYSHVAEAYIIRAFYLFSLHSGPNSARGEKNLKELNSGLKQMDRFTLTSTLPDDKQFLKEPERVASIWIVIFV